LFLLLPVVVLLLLHLEDKDTLDCLVEDERVLSRCCGCGCGCAWLGSVLFLTDKRHEGNVDAVEVVVVAVVVGTNGSDDVDGNDIIIFSPSPPPPPSTIIR
jgi:hypothetical protein